MAINLPSLINRAASVADKTIKDGIRKKITLSGQTVGDTPVYFDGQRTDITPFEIQDAKAFWKEASGHELGGGVEKGDAFASVEAVHLVVNGSPVIPHAISTITRNGQNWSVVHASGNHMVKFHVRRVGDGGA